MATNVDSKGDGIATEVGPVNSHQEDDLIKPAGLTEDELVRAEALSRYEPNTSEERRLVRKIDFILLPVLWWMYVLAYIDRGNVVSIVPKSRSRLRC
jgi:hypothetical protein